MPEFVYDRPPQQDQAADCPPQRPPRGIGPEPSVDGLPDCPIATGGAIPPVGSADWCECIDSIVEWVTKVGDELIHFLLPNFNANGLSNYFGKVLSALLPGFSLLKGFTNLADALGYDVSSKVLQLYDMIRSVITKTGVGCPATVLGAEVLRMLLHSLDRLRIGTDALAWITIDLKLGMTRIDLVLSYVENYACPVEIPTMGEVIECLNADTAPFHLLRCWARLRGYNWDVMYPVIYAQRRKPEQAELGRIRNRELISQDEYLQGLRQLGFTNAAELSRIANLKNEVPGPSDLIRMAVRHVFEPDLLAKFGFNDERELGAFKLDIYHHTAGLDYPIFTGPLANVVTEVSGQTPEALASQYDALGLPEPTWAHAYWWMHWQLPPWTWAADARFRLDPDRDKTLEPEWMRELEFTDQDYNDLLRMNDYPPYFRRKMLALSYVPQQLRFVRLMLADNQLTRAQLIGQLSRMRLLPAVAEKFADALLADIADKQNPVRSLEHGWHIRIAKSVFLAYKVGTLDRAASFDYLSQVGLSADAIEVYLNAIDSDLRAKLVADAVRQIQKDYLEGAINIGDAQSLLAQAGVTADRAKYYLSLWTFKRNLTVKMASTGQLLSWYTQGIIDQPTLLLRLGNLGWIYPDLLALIAESEQRLAKRQQQLQASALKSVRANAAAIDKLLKDARKQVIELQNELKRLVPVGRLIKWARQGSVSEIYFENMLRSQGYPSDIIAKYWQEVIKDGPIPKPAKSKQPTGIAVSSTTTSESVQTAGPSQGQLEQASASGESGPVEPTR